MKANQFLLQILRPITISKISILSKKISANHDNQHHLRSIKKSVQLIFYHIIYHYPSPKIKPIKPIG